MNHLLAYFNSWSWFGLAIILFMIEMMTGSGFLLLIGIAAIVLGLLLLVSTSMAVATQLIIFSASSLVAALGWRVYLHAHPTHTDEPKLNRRAEQYIGRKFTLETPIINGIGVLHVDDSLWRLKCEDDLPMGTSVYISGAEGVILVVKKQES